jgi:hypothetical protein
LTDATFGEHDAVSRTSEAKRVIFTIFSNTDFLLMQQTFEPFCPRCLLI